MSGDRAPMPAVGVILLGALALVASLFLSWSHQLPPVERATFAGPALYGIVADPDALQVYAIAGEILAALAIAAAVAGVWGARTARGVALGAVALGLAFVAHACGTPPTNGLLLTTSHGGRALYFHDPATAGPGETVALIGLILCAAGLLTSCVLPRRMLRSTAVTVV